MVVTTRPWKISRQWYLIVLTATAKISLGGSTMKPSHTREQMKTLRLWKQSETKRDWPFSTWHGNEQTKK